MIHFGHQPVSPAPLPRPPDPFSAAEQSIPAFNDRGIGPGGMAARVEVYVAPGNHSILEEPQVRDVAEILGSLLGDGNQLPRMPDTPPAARSR